MPQFTRPKTIFLILAVTAVLTILCFWAAVPDVSWTQAAGLFFLLLCEGVCGTGLFLTEAGFFKTQAKVFRIGAWSSLISYLIIGGITALLFIVADLGGAGFLACLEGVYLGLLIISFLAFAAAGHSSDRSAAQEAGPGHVLELSGKLSSLLGRLPEGPQKEKLSKITEEVRFFNRSLDLDTDYAIDRKIEDLSRALPAPGASAGSEGLDPMLEELLNLTRQRTQEAQAARRGQSR
ncbi:MAG: hypothetical protein LBK52_02420 [Deltaproteobacteria bacterium]|jgi:hypothetical protein|nr:hypothetical protein [Deltaproteobacteria bacterium]